MLELLGVVIYVTRFYHFIKLTFNVKIVFFGENTYSDHIRQQQSRIITVASVLVK